MGLGLGSGQWSGSGLDVEVGDLLVFVLDDLNVVAGLVVVGRQLDRLGGRLVDR